MEHGTHIQLNLQLSAEHFDLELQIQLEVGRGVHLGENGHDAHEPGIRLLKDLRAK